MGSERLKDFSGYVRAFSEALDCEIQALRKRGGQTLIITDGRRIGLRNGRHLYSFNVDAEIRLPDDTPIEVIHQGSRHAGILISVEGFDLLLGIEKNIGETVSQARLVTEPWFLLAKLQERLTEAKNHDESNKELALQLLSGSYTQKKLEEPEFAKVLSRIEQKSGLSINSNPHQLLGNP